MTSSDNLKHDERWAVYNAKNELVRVEEDFSRTRVEMYYEGLSGYTVRRVRIVPVESEEAK